MKTNTLNNHKIMRLLLFVFSFCFVFCTPRRKVAEFHQNEKASLPRIAPHLSGYARSSSTFQLPLANLWSGEVPSPALLANLCIPRAPGNMMM